MYIAPNFFTLGHLDAYMYVPVTYLIDYSNLLDVVSQPLTIVIVILRKIQTLHRLISKIYSTITIMQILDIANKTTILMWKHEMITELEKHKTINLHYS